MTNPIFKKTIFISLLGHLTVFSIFNLSFGNRVIRLDYNSIFFLGDILSRAELTKVLPLSDSKEYNLNTRGIKNDLLIRSKALRSESINKELPFSFSYYAKPTVDLTFNPDKIIFSNPTNTILSEQLSKKPVIMFYPQLPYHFLLYFKDRQAVHIEVMFNIVSDGAKKALLLKRKISSGNLEADLLSMRYISHYLFIEQANFSPNSWQTVKIDLSTKND